MVSVRTRREQARTDAPLPYTSALRGPYALPHLVDLHEHVARRGVFRFLDGIMDLDVQLARVVRALLALERALDDRT